MFTTLFKFANGAWHTISGLVVRIFSLFWVLVDSLWQVATHPRSAGLGAWMIASPIYCMILVTIAASVLTWMMPLFWALNYNERSKIFDEIAERSLAVAITDHNDRFVGYLNRREEIDIVRTTRPTEVFGEAIYPDHKSIVINDAPDHYWNCLVSLEDKRLRSWLNPNGIDFVGVMQIPISAARASLSEGRLRLGRGGSTVHMQLVRSMLKRFPGNSELGQIERRLIEYRDATILSRKLKATDDDDPLRRWAALHLPHVQGGLKVQSMELKLPPASCLEQQPTS